MSLFGGDSAHPPTAPSSDAASQTTHEPFSDANSDLDAAAAVAGGESTSTTRRRKGKQRRVELSSAGEDEDEDEEGHHDDNDNDNDDDDNDDDDDDEYYYDAEEGERPNRSRHPARTWRRHAQSAIELAKSLEQAEAGNLGLHLLNAHLLRQRLRSSEPLPGPQPEEWADPGVREEFVRGLRGWTAWPLEWEELPGPDETFGQHDYGGEEEEDEQEEDGEEVEGQGIGMAGEQQQQQRPDQRLADSITSMILKHAKERWRAREWEDGGSETMESPSSRSAGLGGGEKRSGEEKEDSNREANIEEGDEDEDVEESEEGESEDGEEEEEEGGYESSSAEDASTADEHKGATSERAMNSDGSENTTTSRLNEEIGSSNAEGMWSEKPSASASRTGSPGEPPLRPVILADDDKARRLLRPSVNSIMSKLDNLLLAIMRSRQHQDAYSSEGSQAGSSVAGEDCEHSDVDQQPSSSKGDQKSSAGGKGKKKKRTKDEPGDLDDHVSRERNRDPEPEGSKRPQAARRRSSSSRPPRRGSGPRVRGEGSEAIGLRDWSEVLGLAAMTGWDEAVVKRAAQRCADLFGEGMSFRTLHEENALRPGEQPVSFLPGQRVGPMDSSGGGDDEEMGEEKKPMAHEDEMVGGVHVDGFLRPIDPRRVWKAARKESRKASGASPGPSEHRKKRARTSG